MNRTIFANCPTCKKANALTVRVGLKSTNRQAACPVCKAKFVYSCWVTKREEGVVSHQVDLVPIEPPRCLMCKRLLGQPDDPLSLDCGGDCLGCMQEMEKE